MKRLENKCAIVTGGASGIGKATALLLAQEGAAVVMPISMKSKASKQRMKSTLQGRALFVRCNVAKAEDCERVVQTAVKTFGRLDIVFNNAGIIHRTNVMDISRRLGLGHGN